MTMTYCQYVSDNGTTYQRRCDVDLAAVLALTTEALGAHQLLPRNIKPRYVLFKAPSGQERRAVGVGAAAGIFTGATTSLTWVPEKGVTTGDTVARAGAVGEKRYAR